jgi:hypothetical protein
MENKNYQKIYLFVIVLLVFVIIWLLGNNTSKNDNIKIYKNNIEALSNEVDSFRLKNNELVVAKQNLILEKNELEEYLDISKKEIKELEKKLDNKIKYIASIEGKVTIDTIEIHDSIYIDPNGNMSLYFDYSDKWVTLAGHSTQTTFDDFYTTLDTLSMNVPLKVGLTDDRKIFVQSSNPYMNITDIKGAYVDESQLRKIINRFGLCFYLGWGIQYGVINQKFDTGPQGGFGIYYRIY